MKLGRIFLILTILGLGALAFGAMSARELNNKGLAQMSRNEFSAAIESFQKAQRILPTDATLRQNEILARNAWGVTLGTEGKFAEGERELNLALAAAPENTMISGNLSVLRTNWAMHMMEQGEHEAAEKMFYKAYDSAEESEFREIDTRRSQNMTVYAQQDRKARRDLEALAKLKTALEIDPENVVALLDAAEIHYDLGENLEALDNWTRAEKLKPDIPDLAKKIDKVLRETQTEQNFSNHASSRFNIAYEGEAARALAEHTLKLLETAYTQIGAELKFHPQRRLSVVLYTPEQYKSVTAAPHWAGAVYDGKIRVPVPVKQLDAWDLEQLRQALYHEYTHAVVHELAGEAIPSWFNEGVSMYFEHPPEQRPAQLHKDARELATKSGALQPIMSMPEDFTTIANEQQARQAYQLARAFVLWLGEKQRPYLFTAVLEGVKKGQTLDQAIEEVYGLPTATLESQFFHDLKRAGR